MSELDWPTLHAYRKLVSEGKVKKLLCEVCTAEYIPAIDTDEKPVLVCFFCNTSVKPGLWLASNIRAVVKEHYG